MREYRQFVRSFRADFSGVGSLIPTSRFAARALAAECAGDPRPKRILEAGPGTGAVTREIIRALGPLDTLTLVERNLEFVDFLRGRLARDAHFTGARGHITLTQGDVTTLDGAARFEHIVSAIPFSNLPPEVVGAILARYKALLVPGGTLSFIEYIHGRRLRIAAMGLLGHDAARAAAQGVEDLIAGQAAAHEFRRVTVLRNVPPAWVRRWRFD